MRDARATRALIVGAGIGGLSAAIALRRAGIEVTVFERMGRLAEVGAGLLIWTNGMKAVEQLGLTDEVLGQGVALQLVENRTWHGALISTVPVAEIDRRLSGHSIAIHRGRLLALLAGALEEGVLQVNAQCTGLVQDTTSVTARFADGRTERGDLLVGADGLKSTVRAQRFGDVKPRYSGFAIWRGIAKLEHEGFPPGLVLQVRGPRAVFGITTLAGGNAYWFGSMGAREGEQDPPGERKSRALQRFAKWYGPVVDVIEATEESAIIRTDVYDRTPIKHWGAGRMTLLGDAAHPTVPSLGQGACMAIEDAVVLARYLSSSEDVPSDLRRYELVREARTASVVRLARRLAWIDHWENPVAQMLRDTAFRILPSTALARRLEKVVDYNP